MICSKNKCTGCFACANKCPKNCINMTEDKFGHIYPSIDEDICIHCNLCKKVCPANNPIEKKKSLHAYAAWSKNENGRLASTSGGIATLLSEYVIKKNGVVYGASISVENQKAIIQHKRVDTLSELKKLRGSKYVHSYIQNTYKDAEQDLKKDKLVLFIGTPCQIAGLKSYLSKDYANLYCVDIICHGVPSQKILNDEISQLNIEENFDYFTFRDPSGFNFSILNEQKILKRIPYFESLYYQSFLDSLTYRENCYNCPYATENRLGDITLGDFWGLGNLKTLKKEEDKGISLCLINTEKGKVIFKAITDLICFEEREISEAINGNSQLRHPSKIHKNRKLFMTQYLENNNFKSSLENGLEFNSLKNKLKRSILRNKFLVSMILKIKKR